MTIGGLAQAGAVLLLGGFGALVLIGLLRGTINTRGLVHDAHGGFSPSRAVTLLVSVGFALGYVGEIAGDPAATGFPEIPETVLLLLAGSGGTYLASKSFGGFSLAWLARLFSTPPR